MALNFTPEQEAEVFEHLYAIQESMDHTRADIAEIKACFDRIDENVIRPFKLRQMLGLIP